MEGVGRNMVYNINIGMFRQCSAVLCYLCEHGDIVGVASCTPCDGSWYAMDVGGAHSVVCVVAGCVLWLGLGCVGMCCC